MKKLFTSVVLLFCLLSNWFDASSQTPQWRTLPNSPTAPDRHEDVFFINAYTGWVANISGKIFKTTDGGITWVTQFNTQGNNFRSIGFADSLSGWAGGLPYYQLQQDTNILYRTTNGGANWSLVPKENFPNPKPTGICGIWVVNNSVMYACGRYDGPARFLKTTNGGVNWITSDLAPLANSLVDCYFMNRDSGLVVGGIGSPFQYGKGIVLFTSNGGANWVTRFTTPDSGQWGWKISFPSTNVGCVSLEKFSGPAYFLKTTDRGMNWEYKLFRSSGYDEEGIGFVNENSGWIGGWTGNSYETTDGGNTWAVVTWGLNLNRFRFLNDTLGYSVGRRVYKYSITPIGIQPISNEVPESYKLEQNYPNPFNAVTKVRFEISELKSIQLNIYDILGREVATLVNEELKPGKYEVEWDGVNSQAECIFTDWTQKGSARQRKWYC